MKRTVIAAALIAVCSATALAQPATAASRAKLPAGMLGDWCVEADDPGTYRRGRDCRNSDGWLEIKANRYRAHETDCVLLTDDIVRDIHYCPLPMHW